MRTMAMPSLDDVAQEAAAGDEIKRYLAVRGIKTTATLALLATNLEQLDRVLVKPLMDGWPIEGSTPITLTPSEQPIATAILHHMWSECRSLWSKMQAAATPASFPTATPPSSHASGSAAPATEDKAPKQLPHGVWNKLLHNYERQQIDGRTRTFPVQEVLGAELVLARLHWKHETSKLYTPVKLGELLELRTFLPSGEINPLSKKERSGSTLVISDNKLVQQEETSWQPRSVLAILDGLASIKWAFILVGLGDEPIDVAMARYVGAWTCIQQSQYFKSMNTGDEDNMMCSAGDTFFGELSNTATGSFICNQFNGLYVQASACQELTWICVAPGGVQCRHSADASDRSESLVQNGSRISALPVPNKPGWLQEAATRMYVPMNHPTSGDALFSKVDSSQPVQATVVQATQVQAAPMPVVMGGQQPGMNFTPPPTVPAGSYLINEKFQGNNTMMLGCVACLFCGPCGLIVCCLQLDERQCWLAPNGRRYDLMGKPIVA
eukprot:symbB.v1.2.027146.t1/scaffold2766.1/size72856/3